MNKFTVTQQRGETYPTIKKFPGGEVLINCLCKGGADCRIDAILTNSDDVMALVMLVDSIRAQGIQQIRLIMPYVPYARQDRVCNPGESLSIRAFAKIINSLEFNSVVIYDPHSDVTSALIDRCIVEKSCVLMQKHIGLWSWICKEYADGTPLYLVSPDAGAVKKTYEIAKKFPQFKGIIFAEKVRDVATGNIVRTSIGQLPDDFCDAKLLICDDICDGGRTFIELGKVLKAYNPKEMNLYVTHGIFSQGEDILHSVFENVWCTIKFKDYQ